MRTCKKSKQIYNAHLQEEVRQEQHTHCYQMWELSEKVEGQQGQRRRICRFLFVFWQDSAKV